MKRICAFIIILTIIILSNVILINQGEKLIDYFNLIFLNIDSFPYYHLEKFNFQYIISFALLTNVIIYYLISEINESITFLNLMIYRVGLNKVFNILQKEEIKKMIIIFFIIIICILIFYESKNGLSFLMLKDFLSPILYLIKYSLLLSIFTMLYNIMSIFGKNERAIILLNILSILFIFIDLFFMTNIITFSSNIITELFFCLLFLAVVILICIYKKFKFKKRSDILWLFLKEFIKNIKIIFYLKI